MGKVIDETGNRYGRLIALKHTGNDKRKQALWLCQCDCGNQKIILGTSLRKSFTHSCGCLGRERAVSRNTTHGMRNTSIYRIWSSMRSRVRNTRHSDYASYGGRGITICKRWDKFENFFKDMGKCPRGMSLDRVDNDGDYTPDNCRWATPKQQARNRRNSLRLTFEGETHTIIGWAERVGMHRSTLRSRLVEQGWSIEKALTTPVA